MTAVFTVPTLQPSGKLGLTQLKESRDAGFESTFWSCIEKNCVKKMYIF